MLQKLATYFILLYGLSACAATKTYDPFKIAHADIRGRVKVVALVPIELSTDAEDPAAVKAKFEWLIRSKLEEGGFKVIPSDEFASILKKTVEKLGPVYDPPRASATKRNSAQPSLLRPASYWERPTRMRCYTPRSPL
jgi:hypothetical protein